METKTLEVVNILHTHTHTNSSIDIKINNKENTSKEKYVKNNKYSLAKKKKSF